jgi:hypothetical protein
MRRRGPNRPYCPKSRRRDGGTGEAVTRPVAVTRRTTRLQIGSPCGGLSADHGQKRETRWRDDHSGRLDITGPLQKGVYS